MFLYSLGPDSFSPFSFACFGSVILDVGSFVIARVVVGKLAYALLLLLPEGVALITISGFISLSLCALEIVFFLSSSCSWILVNIAIDSFVSVLASYCEVSKFSVVVFPCSSSLFVIVFCVKEDILPVWSLITCLLLLL